MLTNSSLFSSGWRCFAFFSVAASHRKTPKKLCKNQKNFISKHKISAFILISCLLCCYSLLEKYFLNHSAEWNEQSSATLDFCRPMKIWKFFIPKTFLIMITQKCWVDEESKIFSWTTNTSTRESEITHKNHLEIKNASSWFSTAQFT